jgi:hypothetical protein
MRNFQNTEFHFCCGLPHLYCMSFKRMSPGRSPGQFWLKSYQINMATIKLENLSFNLHFYILKMGHWFTGEANRLSSHPPGFHSRCVLWQCPTCMAWVSKGWHQVEVLGNFGWIATAQTWNLNRMKSVLCSAAYLRHFSWSNSKKKERGKQRHIFHLLGIYWTVTTVKYFFSIWFSDPAFILLGFPVH